MKHIEKYIGIALLLGAVIFNLWLYRLEPTAIVDPNDNPFQYALVDRTNQMWDYASRTCPKNLTYPLCHISLLVDHWVPNWAQGYNLPFYYSHAPQIAIVTSFRLLQFVGSQLTLFQYYHWIIYFLLCLFPVSVFFALRLTGMRWLTAGIGALIASHLSTDGLYGLDPSSFLWRGYGLSSQLFAMIFFPLAIAGAYKLLTTGKGHVLAIATIALTTMGHLGIGIMTFLSAGIMAITQPILLFIQGETKEAIQSGKKNIFLLVIVLGIAGFLLSYWIVPILLYGDYHNNSFWDPIWKFNSYPWKETVTRLFNGELFDFGRLPILTALIFIGMFVAVKTGSPLALLFPAWLLLYFGRSTWGGLIDLIPGMKDFHISRFIVGLHITGLFLAPLGFEWIIQATTQQILRVSKKLKLPSVKYEFPIQLIVFVLSGILLVAGVYPQTIRYAQHNDTLIVRGNENGKAQWADAQLLIDTLKNLPPGRIFAGRGGGFGKDLKIAETPYYMHLSTYGLPTILWLPETWSPNSDTEQYFTETKLADYHLYNIRYVVAPPSVKPEEFWNELPSQNNTWKLYEVEPLNTDPDAHIRFNTPQESYITTGVRAAVVSSSRDNFVNVVRLWIQSDYPRQRLYPELTFDSVHDLVDGLPTFRMKDESTYETMDGKTMSLFGNIPIYSGDTTNLPIVGSLDVDSDMSFSTTINVPDNCKNCIAVLKQTQHPNWKVYIDGKKHNTFTVFPFYTAVAMDEPGNHEVRFAYEPSAMKQLLLTLSFLGIIVLVVWKIKIATPVTSRLRRPAP